MSRNIIVLSGDADGEFYFALDADFVARYLPDEQERKNCLEQAVDVIDRVAWWTNGSGGAAVSAVITEDELDEGVSKEFWPNSKRVVRKDHPLFVRVDWVIPPAVWEWLLQFLIGRTSVADENTIAKWRLRYRAFVQRWNASVRTKAG